MKSSQHGSNDFALYWPGESRYILSDLGTAISLVKALAGMGTVASELLDTGRGIVDPTSSRSSRAIATRLLVKPGDAMSLLAVKGDMMTVLTVAMAVPLASRIRRRSSQLGNLPLSIRVDSGNSTGRAGLLGLLSFNNSVSNRRCVESLSDVLRSTSGSAAPPEPLRAGGTYRAKRGTFAAR